MGQILCELHDVELGWNGCCPICEADENKGLRNDLKYLEEHHHITETAIGIAKLKLMDDDTEGAMKALKDCNQKLDEAIKLYQPATARMMELSNE